MLALVTGGAGFIGSHLVDRLLQEGFRVRILDSLEPKVHPKGIPAYLQPAAEFLHGDVTDRETLLFALRDVDVVFHQAAYQDYMPDFSHFFSVNATGTALIYELIVQHRLRVKKVIVASSQAVYGEGQYMCSSHGFFQPSPRTQEQLALGQWEVMCPECGKACTPKLLVESHSNPYNQYAVSKLAEEKIALGVGWLQGIPSVGLRYSITQGPRQSLFNNYSGLCRIFVSLAMNGRDLTVYEDGLQTRDFVHVQDVVDANLRVLREDADFQAFNVGSGIATSVLDYADLVCSKLHSRVGVNLRGEYRRGDNRHSVSSINKLQQLGWNPRRGLTTILDDFLEWVESIGGIPDDVPNAYEHMKVAGVVLKASSGVMQ